MQQGLGPGSEIGGLRLVRLLARGGMGVLWEADDPVLGRRVAVKLVAPELARDAGFRDRFLAEARIAAGLEHPNIVPVYAAGYEGEHLYIASRLIAGGDLRQRLSEGPLPVAEAISIVRQTADALDCAHAAGLIHRDVKPSNILLGEDATAYLADFGLAGRPVATAAAPAAGLTGTADYIAPEVIEGRAVDRRADVYSLGCVLFECLCGEPPFRHPNELATIYAHLSEEAPRPSSLRDGLPAGLDPVLATALAKDPGDRYAEAGSLAAASQAAVAPAAHRRGRAALVAALVAAAAAAAVAAFVAHGGASSPQVTANEFLRVDAGSAKVATAAPVGGRPSAVTPAGSGVWVALDDSGTIVRVDRASGRTTQKIATGGPVNALAASGGTLWASRDLARTLLRIDLASGTITQRIPVANSPIALAVSHGSVWVASRLDGTVTRIDAGTGTPGATIAIGGGLAALMAYDGEVWAVSADQNSVTRIDPQTPGTRVTIPVGASPAAVIGGGGAVWVANSDGGSVTRIDAARARVTATYRVGGRPDALAWSNGLLWIGDGAGGGIRRLDPATRRVGTALAPGLSAAALAGTGGDVVAVTLARRAYRPGGTLNVVSGVFPNWPLDPATGSNITTWVFDGLVTYRRSAGSAGFQIVPDLARALPSIADAGTTYRFRLRSGILFSNGKRVRASDVAASIRRLLVARTFGRPIRGIDGLASVVGAQRCLDTPARCDLSAGVVADDARGTVVIHLRRRDETFLSTLASPQLGVVPAGSPSVIRPRNRPPGTGPYVVARYVPGKLVVYRRNRHFRVWSQEARPDGIPDVIHWRIDVARAGGDTHRLNRQLRLVEQGKADIAYNTMSASDAALVRLQHPSQVRVTTFPGGGVWGYWLNTARGLFHSLAARRAVNLAVDRRRYTRLGDPATPSCQITGPGYPGYVPYCPYTRGDTSGGVYHGPDLPRALRLLRAAGLDGRRVVLVGFKGDPRWDAYDRETARTLRELGFKVVFKRFGFDQGDAYADAQKTADIWETNQPPETTTTIAQQVEQVGSDCSPQAVADGALCDATTRSLRRRARAARDPAESQRLWTRLDQHLTDEAVWLPVTAETNIAFLSRRVRNYGQQPVLGTLYDELAVR